MEKVTVFEGNWCAGPNPFKKTQFSERLDTPVIKRSVAPPISWMPQVTIVDNEHGRIYTEGSSEEKLLSELVEEVKGLRAETRNVVTVEETKNTSTRAQESQTETQETPSRIQELLREVTERNRIRIASDPFSLDERNRRLSESNFSTVSESSLDSLYTPRSSITSLF